MTRRDSGTRLRFTGGQPLAEAVGMALAALDQLVLQQHDRHRLAILIEELLANLFEHGELRDHATVMLRLERQDEHVLLTLEDAGIAFDPRSAVSDAPVPERGGGAGLALVRAWAEALSYQAGAPLNRLELRYSLKPATQSKI